MRNQNRLLLGLLLCPVLVSPLSVQSADFWQPRWYFSLDPGINLVDDTHFEAREKPVFTDTVTGEGDFGAGSTNRFNGSFKSGFAIGISGGFEFNPWISLGIRNGFSYNSIDSLSRVSSSGDTRITAPFTEGSIWQDSLLPEITLKYPITFSNGGKLTPLIGAGAGVAIDVLDLQGLRVQSDGFDTSFHTTSSDVAGTYQLFGGLRYDFNDNVCLGIYYRYSHTEDLSFDSNDNDWFIGNGDQINIDDLNSHTISLGFTYRF